MASTVGIKSRFAFLGGLIFLMYWYDSYDRHKKKE